MNKSSRKIIMSHFNYKMSAKPSLLFFAKSCLLIMSLFLATVSINAQEKTIPVVKGTVKNEANESLTGATISVKNTKIVGVTKDGIFELKNVPEGATLRITYVGHNPVEVKLKPGQSEVSVTMTSTSGVMNEVVVNTG